MCVWGKAPLGLAGGHAALVAHGWQSCLADEGIIHIAPLPCYNMPPQLYAYGQNCCATDSSPAFGETLYLPGQMVGNNLSTAIRKIFAGPLLLSLSCPWTCQNKRLVHQLVRSVAHCLWSKEYLHSSSEAETQVWVHLGAQIAFWIVAPGYWLV